MNLVDPSGNPQQGQQKGTPITKDQLIDIKCNSCEADLFEPLFYMKKVPGFITGGKDQYVPIQTWRCAGCGEINEEFKLKNLV